MLDSLYLNLKKYTHYIYLLYAIPMVYLAATLTPPFQVPDEPNHFMRAEQVSRFELVADFVHDKSNVGNTEDSLSTDPTILYPEAGGFNVDKGIILAESFFSPIAFNPTIKLNKLKLDSAKSVKWGMGMGLLNFGNTAIYSPIVYTMPALGIIIGKTFNLSIIQTLYISRLLNGFLSIILCFYGLLLAKRSNILMFIVLLLPMCIAIFGSVSQDAVLISCAFLLVGVIDNAEFSKIAGYLNWQIWLMVILITVIGLSKPPYMLFALSFLFLSISTKQKILLIGVPSLLVMIWLFIDRSTLSVIWVPPNLHINAKLQISHMLQHPFKFISLFFKVNFKAVIHNIAMFIGILGWLDLKLPISYYIAALGVIIVGFVNYGKLKNNDHVKVRFALLISAFITLLAVMTIQYITWTALDSPVLDGMQGRYLLPLFPFLALGFSSSAIDEKIPRIKKVLSWLILLFPLITALTMVEGLLSRYYN